LKLGKVTIRRTKLTHYLLVRQDEDDKSGYLALAGFTQETVGALMQALERLAHDGDANESRTNDYGVLLYIDGHLVGPNGKKLGVRTFWITRYIDGQTHFVTLIPAEMRS
jgi:hypothetical protein